MTFVIEMPKKGVIQQILGGNRLPRPQEAKHIFIINDRVKSRAAEVTPQPALPVQSQEHASILEKSTTTSRMLVAYGRG